VRRVVGMRAVMGRYSGFEGWGWVFGRRLVWIQLQRCAGGQLALHVLEVLDVLSWDRHFWQHMGGYV